MRFDRATAQQIRKGEKTVARRPVPSQNYGYRPRPGGTQVVKPFDPRVGDVWSSSWDDSKGAHWQVHYRATSVVREPVRMLSEVEALEEGFAADPNPSNRPKEQDRPFTAAENFALWWVETFERDWIRKRTVADGSVPDRWFKLARFDCDLVNRPAWWYRVGIEYVGDVPYILPKLPGEMEAVHVESLDPRWLVRAGKRQEKAKAEEAQHARKLRELLDQEERMKRARAAARMNNVDVSAETFLWRRARQQGRSEEAVLARVRSIERIAFREAA